MEEILRTEAQIIEKKKEKKEEPNGKFQELRNSKITGWAQEQRGDERAVSELKDMSITRVSECVCVWVCMKSWGPVG